MEPDEAMTALRALAEQAGVEVRIEPFALKFLGKGGLCRVAGRHVVLIDAALGLLEQVGVLGLALGSMGLRAPGPLLSYLRTGHAPIHRVPYLRPLRPLARGRAS